jgi:hypothetical protein
MAQTKEILMLSRTLARILSARSFFMLALTCSVLALQAGPSQAVRGHLHNYAFDSSHPDAGGPGGGTLEGDIWGGEQITTDLPTDTHGELVDSADTFAEKPRLSAWFGWWNRIFDLLRSLSR